jgi:hypothetical protein
MGGSRGANKGECGTNTAGQRDRGRQNTKNRDKKSADKVDADNPYDFAIFI